MLNWLFVDDAAMHNQIYKFVKTIAPEHALKIKLYQDTVKLFDKYDKKIKYNKRLNAKLTLNPVDQLS